MDFEDKINAVWEEVGREVGAEFKFEDNYGTCGWFGHEASLVRKVGKRPISLRCRRDYSSGPDDSLSTLHWCHVTVMKAPTNSTAGFQFEMVHSGLLGFSSPGFSIGPTWNTRLRKIQIGSKNFNAYTNDDEILTTLLKSKKVRELIPEALGESSLLLDCSELSFKEDWVITDPSRLKALFRLFDALLERLAEPQVHELADPTLEREAQRLLHKECTALQEFGIEARPLELDPLLLPGPRGITDATRWIEINEGPIRWVGVPQSEDRPYELYVPDNRMKSRYPRVTVRSRFKTVRSSTVAGRRTIVDVRWEICWGHGANTESSSYVASRLNQDMSLGETIRYLEEGFHASSEPDLGCWVLSLYKGILCKHGPRTLTHPIWDCYLHIANDLLAILVFPERQAGLEKRQEAWEKLQLARKEDHAALQNLGIEVRVPESEQPSPKLAGIESLEVTEGHIRWFHYSLDHGRPARYLYVPDLRLQPNFPWRKRHWISSVRVKSFPVIGPVKAVLWQESSQRGARTGKEKKLVSFIAQSLTQDEALEKKIVSSGHDISIRADPRRQCWILYDRNLRTITKQLWDCYEAIARRLLAMPLHKGTEDESYV